MKVQTFSFAGFILQIGLSTILPSTGSASKCLDRTPNGTLDKVPGDNGFYLEIHGGLAHYQPSATYTIKLTGRRTQDGERKFTSFILVSENSDHSLRSDPGTAGNFQLLGDVLTRYSDHCTNTITQTSDILKSEIQVLWTAPPPGTGCINFKAMVVDDRLTWSMDNGGLNLKVCEEKEKEEQNHILEKCCACSEAKYEVIFEGLWSTATHPKDFPQSEWLLHFSDVIGASHAGDYRIWEEGGLASKGLIQVAKWGSPRILESELKAKSSHIRTIIKSRGLWYPNVNGKTFSIFRTDPRNHLVSLVSMLGPSPDWIVGISALEMCRSNCSWMDKKEMYLYPLDAGVDSGISYESPDSPTSPQEPIERITTRNPSHPSSPFYNPDGGQMKPLAKLTIQKLREYKKSCSLADDSSQYPLKHTRTDADMETQKRSGCHVTEWSDWTGCSVTCGKGISSRSRQYIDIFKARQMGCNEQLVEKEMCSAKVPACQGGSNFYSVAPRDWVPDDMCGTTEWTSWSDCSATCGKGFRVRTRRFFNRMGRKQCPHVETVMKQECSSSRSVCLPGQIETIDPECSVTLWSLWSPCSVSCGSGIKVRTRLYRVTREQQVAAGCNIKLMEKGTCTGTTEACKWAAAKDVCGQKMEVGPCRGFYQRWYHDSSSMTCKQFTFGGCRGNSNNFLQLDDCRKLCANYKNKGSGGRGPLEHSMDLVKDKNFMLALDVLAQDRREQETDGMNSVFIEIDQQRQVVSKLEGQEKNLGVFFNRKSELMAAQKKLMMMEKQVMKKKQMEVYSQKQRMMEGKRQNDQALDPYNRAFSDSSQVFPRSSLLAAASPHVIDAATLSKQSLYNTTQHSQDCELTSWSPWSVQCSATCGRGFRQRFRTISQPAIGFGQPCSRKLEKKKKCRLPACADTCRMSPWGSWGPCSRTCGSDGQQSRHKQVISGVGCLPGEESRVCLLSCCPGDRGC